MAVRTETVALQGVERERLVRRAQLLAWASLAWMTAEGVIALVAGVLAGSIALIGFGIDSGIEGLASVIIIWRFWGARAMSERAERRAQKFGIAKQRVAVKLNSRATMGEGAQNMLCAYLSVAVLAGLALNAELGWWWADPLAALVIAGVAVREGLEAWRGEDCC